MWSVENIILTLKEIKEKNKISGAMDAGKYCRELGINMNELVYLFSFLFVEAFREVRELDDERRRLKEENERLNKLLSESCRGNGRMIQMAKVKSGMPIAKKTRKSLVDLELQIIFGLSDKELMEYFEISKSTLWRWKKKLKEKKESGESILLL